MLMRHFVCLERKSDKTCPVDRDVRDNVGPEIASPQIEPGQNDGYRSDGDELNPVEMQRVNHNEDGSRKECRKPPIPGKNRQLLDGETAKEDFLDHSRAHCDAQGINERAIHKRGSLRIRMLRLVQQAVDKVSRKSSSSDHRPRTSNRKRQTCESKFAQPDAGKRPITPEQGNRKNDGGIEPDRRFSDDARIDLPNLRGKIVNRGLHRYGEQRINEDQAETEQDWAPAQRPRAITRYWNPSHAVSFRPNASTLNDTVGPYAGGVRCSAWLGLFRHTKGVITTP